MIGILFHGPQIFDTGWAARLIGTFESPAEPPARFMLAGTMARTSLHDSGLQGVETPMQSCSACADLLARDCSTVVFAYHAKSPESAVAFGPMVCSHTRSTGNFVVAETSTMTWWNCRGDAAEVAETLSALGLRFSTPAPQDPHTWTQGDVQYRRLRAVEPGDYVMINGIFIGRALSKNVVLSARGGTLITAEGVDIKPHGLEKLERLAHINLERAKLTSTASLRAHSQPARIEDSRGQGVAFVDHAGRHVFPLTGGCAGAVTVGDDTTAIVGDILRRFSVPVLGITDGDADHLYTSGAFAPGSLTLLVDSDDSCGLDVYRTVFGETPRCPQSFADVSAQVLRLLQPRIISIKRY